MRRAHQALEHAFSCANGFTAVERHAVPTGLTTRFAGCCVVLRATRIDIVHWRNHCQDRLANYSPSRPTMSRHVRSRLVSMAVDRIRRSGSPAQLVSWKNDLYLGYHPLSSKPRAAISQTTPFEVDVGESSFLDVQYCTCSLHSGMTSTRGRS